jgi:hypothetical protein
MSKGSGAIRWIKRSDGIMQRRHIKHLKKFNETHQKTGVKDGHQLYSREVVAKKLKYYRCLKARTYYSTIETGKTPKNDEIADFRVVVISKAPLSRDEFDRLDRVLKDMEWIFASVFRALKAGHLNYEVSGEEFNVQIDHDEGGLGMKRQAIFKGGAFTYNESRIQSLEVLPMKELKGELKEKITQFTGDD